MNNPIQQRLNRWLSRDVTLRFVDEDASYVVRKKFERKSFAHECGVAGPAYLRLALVDDERKHLSFDMVDVRNGIVAVESVLQYHGWQYAPDMYMLAYSLAAELASIITSEDSVLMTSASCSTRWHERLLRECGWKLAFSYEYEYDFGECDEPCHLHECDSGVMLFKKRYYMRPVPQYGIFITGMPVHNKASEWYN